MRFSLSRLRSKHNIAHAAPQLTGCRFASPVIMVGSRAFVANFASRNRGIMKPACGVLIAAIFSICAPAYCLSVRYLGDPTTGAAPYSVDVQGTWLPMTVDYVIKTGVQPIAVIEARSYTGSTFLDANGDKLTVDCFAHAPASLVNQTSSLTKLNMRNNRMRIISQKVGEYDTVLVLSTARLPRPIQHIMQHVQLTL